MNSRSKVTSDIISSIGLHGLNDKKMLLDWLKIYHLDPNDPTNVHILHLNKVNAFIFICIH